MPKINMGQRCRHCRLCLAEIVKDQVANIFTYTLNNSKDSFVHVLSHVFAVEIDAADQFGKDVCSKCIKIIEYVLLVRNTFQMCQEDLRKSIITEKKKESPEDKLKDNNYEYTQYCEKISDVRVSLDNLEAMCQVSVDLTHWEHSSDFMSYRKLSNGAYKPRKRRHFKLDDNLVNDICSSLDENREVGFYNLSKDIGTNTDKPLYTCDCKNDKCIDTDYIANIVNVTENMPPSYLKRANNQLELIRSVNTNTLSWKGTSGVNQKYENRVRVGIQDLCNFAQPKVVLEPVEYLIKREKYEEVGKNCWYIKRNRLNNESTNHYKKNTNSQQTKKRLSGYNNMLSPLINEKKYRTRRLKSGRKNHEKLNMTPKHNFIRLNKEIFDNSETESESEIEGGQHGKKAVEPCKEILSVNIPRLLEHNYEKRLGTNETCETLFNGSENSASNKINENSPKSTFAKTNTYTTDNMCENFIDISTKASSLDSTYKDQQSNSNTEKNVASTYRVKRQRLKDNRFLKKFKKVTPTSENDAPQPSFIWERNCLGKYSAINFYKQSSANKSNISASQSKKDLSLNETILKLAGRLEDPVLDGCSTGANKK